MDVKYICYEICFLWNLENIYIYIYKKYLTIRLRARDFCYFIEIEGEYSNCFSKNKKYFEKRAINIFFFPPLLDIYLRKRFHFSVVCSVIDAQMTPQCGKNKEVTDVLTTLWRPLCIYITEQTTEKWWRWIASDDVIHDLYKSSNVIGSWYCTEIRDWFT